MSLTGGKLSIKEVRGRVKAVSITLVCLMVLSYALALGYVQVFASKVISILVISALHVCSRLSFLLVPGPVLIGSSLGVCRFRFYKT